jgi:hypothetical protein
LPLNEALPGRRFPTALEAAVMRGLSRDPGQRQPSVTTFSEELAGAAAGTTEAPGSGLLGTLRRFMGGKKE